MAKKRSERITNFERIKSIKGTKGIAEAMWGLGTTYDRLQDMSAQEFSDELHLNCCCVYKTKDNNCLVAERKDLNCDDGIIEWLKNKLDATDGVVEWLNQEVEK